MLKLWFQHNTVYFFFFFFNRGGFYFSWCYHSGLGTVLHPYRPHRDLENRVSQFSLHPFLGLPIKGSGFSENLKSSSVFY